MKDQSKMSNLTNLVPPLELCKLIPAGEFEDSVFYWFADLMQINETPPHEYRCTVHKADYKGYNWGGFRCCPAPTLEEILKALSVGFTLTDCVRNFRGWEVDCMVGIDNPSVFDKQSGATAALKLWLKMKGIENE